MSAAAGYEHRTVLDTWSGYMGVDNMTLYYEDLCANPREISDALGAHIDLERVSTTALDGRATTSPVSRIQSTEVNQEWERRYRDDVRSWRMTDEIGPAG